MKVDLRNDLQKWGDERQAERLPGIGASSIDTCYKRLAYEYHGVAPSDERSANAANLGTLLHLGWSSMIRAQHDPLDRDTDVVLHLDELPRPIAADDVSYTDRVVRDLKSTKDVVWQSWLNKGSPYESFWDQLSLYGLALHRLHGGDWTLCVTAINRETGQIQEYERPLDLEVAEALAQKAATRHGALTASVSLVASGADPLVLVDAFPREGHGPGTGMPCDWCPFLPICWPQPSSDDGTPQSETVKEDAEAIGVLAAEYLEASAEQRKWEKRKKDASVFLQGLDGSYPTPDGGTVKVQMVGGKPKQSMDCDAAAERLTELGEEVPMKWDSTARYARITRMKR